MADEPDWDAPVTGALATAPSSGSASPAPSAPAPSSTPAAAPASSDAEPDWSAPVKSGVPDNIPTDNSFGSRAKSFIQSVPFGRAMTAPMTVYDAAKALPGQLSDIYNQFSSEEQQRQAGIEAGNWSDRLMPDTAPLKALGKAASAIVGVPLAPANSMIQDASSLISGGMGYAAQGLSQGVHYVNPAMPAMTAADRQNFAQQTTPDVETALGLVMPETKGLGWRGIDQLPQQVAQPQVPMPTPPNVDEPILTQGMQTGDPGAWRDEQGAFRGDYGPEIQKRAQAYQDQLQQQLEQKRSNISQTLNPNPDFQVENPKDVAGIIQPALQDAEVDRVAQQQAETASREARLQEPRLAAPNHLDTAEQLADTLRNDFNATQQSKNQVGVDLANNGESFRQNLSPDGSIVASNPQSAADMVQQSIKEAEADAANKVDKAYQDRAAIPGEYDADMLGAGPKAIRKDLSSGPLIGRVRVSAENTPRANNALNLIDQTLGADPEATVLPNEATPFTSGRNAETGQFESQQAPQPINGQTMEDLRKAINQEYGRAWREAQGPGKSDEDVRAVARVRDAFDNFVAGVENKGGFSGDVGALRQATSDARAAHADYKNTFESRGPGDTAGKFIENVVGRYDDQSMPANKILSGMYGDPNIAKRVTDIVGEGSPAHTAARQGLYSQMVEDPQGPLPPQKAAANINQQIIGSGRQVSDELLSADEKQQLLDHANNLRSSVEQPTPKTDVVSQTLKQIAGPGGQPMNVNDFSNMVWGHGKDVGASPTGVKIAKYIADTHGQDSEAFGNLQAGTASKLLDADSGPAGLNPTKTAARIREFFNGSGRDFADATFSPETKQEWLRYADELDAHDAYLQSLQPGKLSDVDRAFNRIVGANGTPPATPEEVLKFLFGGKGLGEPGLSARLYQRLADHFGADSPYIQAIKDAHWKLITEKPGDIKDWGPGKVADRIDEMLDTTLAKTMYSPEDRSLIKAYGDLNRKIVAPQASANWSNTAAPLQKTLGDIGHKILMTIGASVGEALTSGIGKIPAAVIGAYAGNKVASVIDNAAKVKKMAQIEKQMPLIADQMAAYTKAVEAARRANMPVFNRLAESAAANLARTLTKAGVDPAKVQLPNNKDQTQ